jgi:hypothetical protein
MIGAAHAAADDGATGEALEERPVAVLAGVDGEPVGLMAAFVLLTVVFRAHHRIPVVRVNHRPHRNISVRANVHGRHTRAASQSHTSSCQ